MSHQRPMSELLASYHKDITASYGNEFAQMTEADVSFKELEDTRELLVELIHKQMTDQEREFLISLKAQTPQWDLLGLQNPEQVAALPSVPTDMTRFS